MGMSQAKKLVKKTIELDEKAIKKLRLIFNVSTDKEAVNHAIRLVSQEDQIIQTHQSLAGSASLKDIFS